MLAPTTGGLEGKGRANDVTWSNASDCRHPDFPGGGDSRFLRTVRGLCQCRGSQCQRQGGALTTSVCTGAFLLGAAGLLDGRQATTHWSTIAGPRAAHPATNVREDARVVDEGEIITSAGVSAGIDMALHVVRRLHGQEIARLTARDMEYDWAAPLVG